MSTSSYDFSDSVVLVTGGGRGIGGAIATAFLEAGASVAVTALEQDELDETVAGHPAERTLALACDVGDRDAVRRMVDEVVERFGRLDVVVSDAGQNVAGDLTELGVEEWESMRRTNVDGFVWLAQRTLPELERTGGNLVAVSSVSGLRGDWGQAAYTATKAAISNLVRSLALDYGERGVRVNAVAPGFTRTAMTESAPDDPDGLAPMVNRIALGRPGYPEDVAPAALFLASSDARYITGVILPVDGGTTASTGQAH